MVVRFKTDDVTIHLAGAGAGKAGWVNALIPTPDGYKRFGTIKVGDKVFSAEGKPVMVTGVYPRGFMDAYRVTLSDGRSSICAADHLWGVYVEGHREWVYKVMSLEEMLSKGIRRADPRPNRTLGRPKFYIPASPVCEYEDKELPVDPYVLGSLIGNGCLTERYLTISSNDEWQVAKVADRLGFTYYKRSQYNFSWDFYKDGKRVRTDSVVDCESLRCGAGAKFIPYDYLTSGLKSRIELLQGLFDTDGCVSTTSGRLHVTYSTTSYSLATGLRQLLLSLGIVSIICEDKREGKNTCYELNVNCDTKLKELLFSLPRKAEKVKSFKRQVKHHYDRVAIRSVEKLEHKLEMQCIMVDDPAHLYLCEDYIVTHNTTAAMQEIVKALATYRPDEIAFVTYTKKGVENGIERALAVNKDLTPDDLMHFKTLHALCFREAHLARKNIITAADIAAFNQAMGFKLSLSDAFGYATEDDRLLQRYDAMRSGSKRGVFVDGNYDHARYERLINAYVAFKEGHDLVDFYDCLLRYMENGEPLQGVKIAFIDECQDLTPLQWQVCMKAFENAEKVICLGDDFQSLYTYNGAAPELLIEMAAHYKLVKHETSYRLPRKVYEFARGITSVIQEKVDKDYKPATDKEGFVKNVTDRNVLARIIRDDLKHNGHKGGRWYLLFRTNCFIADMVKVLEQFMVPYNTNKGFCIPSRDLARIERYYNYRKEGYGTPEARQKFMEEYKIEDINDSFIHSELIPGIERYYYQDLVDTWGLKALREMSQMTEPFLLLSTVHKVKGGEADFTAMFMDCTRLVSENMTLSVDEELRVLYVGCTRCREGLYIVPAQGRYSMSRLVDIIKEVNDV